MIIILKIFFDSVAEEKCHLLVDEWVIHVFLIASNIFLRERERERSTWNQCIKSSLFNLNTKIEILSIRLVNQLNFYFFWLVWYKKKCKLWILLKYAKPLIGNK